MGEANWLVFGGHFHPLVVHLPIGMFFIASILHFFYRDSEATRPFVGHILVWSAGFSILAAALGWALAQSREYSSDTLSIHQWLGIATAALMTLLAVIFRAAGFEKKGLIYVHVLFLSTFVSLAAAGHYGGNLTHGADYLSSNMPASMRAVWGLPAKEPVQEGESIPIISNLSQALVYGQIIKPLLAKKCATCHNAEKQKGGLRLDAPQYISLGGENGAIIKANMPQESELIRRLLLEENDEKHMPPKGKTPLTENEITLIHWWVKHGADYTKKVADLPADEKIKPVLTLLTKGEAVIEKSAVYSLSIDAAEESDLLAIRKLGLLVNPIAQDQPFLEVNAVNRPAITARELEQLSRVKAQIVRLKLGQSGVSDATMLLIKDMPLLVQLDLHETKVTDRGLKELGNLAYLESLNLVKTQVSDAGLEAIGQLKKLKTLYLWQTRVTEKGILALQKMNPNLRVYVGFKSAWPLEIDSAEMTTKK